MLIVNSILIGLVLMLITITLLDRQHNRKALNIKEQEIMSLTKMIVDQNDHINNAVKTSANTLGLVNKLNSTTKKSILELNATLGKTIEMIKCLTRAQQKGMIAHNELVEYTVDELRNIWCDLCEDECEYCPFENTCKHWKGAAANADNNLIIGEDGCPISYGENITNEPTEGEPAHEDEYSEDAPIVKDYDSKGCVGSMTIDPTDPSQIDKLLDKMKQTGMPDAVIENYKHHIGEALKHFSNRLDKLEVNWDSKPISRPFNDSKRATNPIKGDKLINPNSKIVKSLEKILKESK